jgi:hypothetical protein
MSSDANLGTPDARKPMAARQPLAEDMPIPRKPLAGDMPIPRTHEWAQWHHVQPWGRQEGMSPRRHQPEPEPEAADQLSCRRTPRPGVVPAARW